MSLHAAGLFFLLNPFTFAQAPKEVPMPHHAHGTFTVEVKPLTPTPPEGIARHSVNKQFHGDLEGTTQGEMLSAGDPKKGIAGYVAMELVTGMLNGKHGTFVMQHFGTMDASGQHWTVQVVPGSGSGELQGITGIFTITIANGQHSYDLNYDLPQ